MPKTVIHLKTEIVVTLAIEKGDGNGDLLTLNSAIREFTEEEFVAVFRESKAQIERLKEADKDAERD